MVGLKQMTGAMKQIQPIAEESAKKAQWDPKKIPNYKKQLKLYRANNPGEAETLPDRIKQQFPGGIQVGSVSGETAGKVLLRFAIWRPEEKLPAGQLASVRIPSQKHAANLKTPQGHNPNIYKKTQISPIIVYYFHFLTATLIKIFIVALKPLSLWKLSQTDYLHL